MAIADWRTDWVHATPDLQAMVGRLTPKGKKLVDATYQYYYHGKFPSPDLVPRTWPDRVKSQTKEERAQGRNDPGAIA